MDFGSDSVFLPHQLLEYSNQRTTRNWPERYGHSIRELK
jgi:hypothetical protein